MTSDDIHCYRVNYDKAWKEKGDGYTIPAFPCDGAVDAIHALCDEVERLRAVLARVTIHPEQAHSIADAALGRPTSGEKRAIIEAAGDKVWAAKRNK